MSTVIIGGGDSAKHAIEKLVDASVNFDEDQRACAEAFLGRINAACGAAVTNGDFSAMEACG